MGDEILDGVNALAVAPDITISELVLQTTRGPVTALRAVPDASVDNGIPVVLCAGLVGSKEDFVPLIPALARVGYRPFAYDYHGHYAAIDPESVHEHTIQRHANDLLAVLGAIDGDGPPHVLGHSYGGFVVRAAAIARPELLRSVALVGSGPRMDNEHHRKLLSGFDAKLAGEGCAVMWPVVRRLIPENDVARRRYWRSRLDTMRLAFLHGALRSLSAEMDLGADLRATRLATLILHGHRDQRLWSTADFAAYAERAGADLEVIANASHSPNLERPAATAEALLRFWAAVEQRQAVRTFLDLMRPRAVPDPYPAYTSLRRLTPVLKVQLPGKAAAIVLTRHADCARLLQDSEFASAGEAPDRIAPRWREDRLIRCLYQSFGFREGATHSVLRAAVASRLTPRRCVVQRADTERIAETLLDGFGRQLSGGATVNLADALALPFAALVTGRLLDIPDDEALRLGEAARVASAAFEPFMTPRQQRSMAAGGDTLVESLSRLTADRDADGADLLSLVRAHRPDGGEQLAGDLTLLFGAGYDSPASLVTLGAKLLIEHPDQARLVGADPSAVEGCIEEILRFDPPVHIAMRIATAPTRFGEHDVAAGTPVLGMIAAANRDPAYVSEPDRFLVDRQPGRPSLSFGAGRHYCPGAALARMHAQVLFPRLLQRFPQLRIAGPVRYRSPGTMLRGIEDLPVTLAC